MIVYIAYLSYHALKASAKFNAAAIYTPIILAPMCG